MGMILVGVTKAEQGASTSRPSRITGSATTLFVNSAGGAARLANVHIEGPAARVGGTLRMDVEGKVLKQEVPPAASGGTDVQVLLPVGERVGRVALELRSADHTLTGTMDVPPAKRWKIFVAPTVHTDIGYTHHQSQIPEIHNANTDLAIALCSRFADYRFRLEGSWAARVYEQHRPREQFDKLIERVRQRRIGIEATYVNMLTGLCSAEELIRLLYPSADLVRRFGIPFETATQNDTPSYVWSFPTVLRRAGVRYLTVGVNNNGTRGPMLRGGLDRKSPFWWAGPDGSKVLTWYAGGYVDVRLAGLSEGLRAAERKLVDWITRWEQRSDYPYDAILIHGAYGDNQRIDASLAETVTAWNAKYAYPKLILTGFGEFFDYVEKHFADRIPTIRGCGGCWWEDGAASSAHETAVNRANHHRIVAAEAVWSVLSVLPEPRPYPHDPIRKAWDAILMYDEHTWGARRWSLAPEHENVVTQWATKAAFATDADRCTRSLLEDGLHLLGRNAGGTGKGVLVFNPVSWDRSDLVRLVLPRGADVVGADGRRVPMQTFSVAGQNKEVCFQTREIPGMGYRRYDLVESNDPDPPAAPAGESPGQLENRFYRVTLDAQSGGIASLLDKQTGVELVDRQGPYKLGEVVYASGGKGTKAVDWRLKDPARFEFSRPNGASWQMVSRGPLLTSARSRTQLKMFPHVGLEVTLYEDIKRLDLTVHLEKTLTYEPEGVYVAFPFAADKPEFRIEIGGGWVRPDRDMLPGACLDWFCTQGSVIVRTDAIGVSWSPVDTPLFSLCGIHTGKWLEKIDLTNGTIFAYVMNNYWPTNYAPGQSGRFAFRYSITSDRHLSTLAATRHGWGAARPLIATTVEPPSSTAPLPRASSFCRLSSPNVVLTAFKRAEDDNGFILRFMEVAGQATRFDVSCGVLPAPKSAWRCDAVERNIAPLAVRDATVGVDIDAFGIETVRLQM